MKKNTLVLFKAALWVALGLFSPACGSSTPTQPAADGGAAAATDGGAAAADGGASTADGGAATADAGVDKAANCASTFGDQIPASSGRIDGTVRAVLKPTDQQCTMPNGTHVIVQVDMNGATYRMVVNIDVLMMEKTMALPTPWSEGWHSGTNVDYVTALGVHSNEFTSYSQNAIVQRILDRIEIGARISVYASTDRAMSSSAHLVHRNGNGADGAIVVGLDATPTFLLFRFANQSF